jgi:drug/metabolite transporter (DMT)-like permease
MKQLNLHYVYLTLTIVLWSLTPAVAKLALNELDNFQLLFYTSIIGVISLSILCLKRFKELKRLKSSDLMKMFGMGALGIFLYHVLLFRSYAMAPAGQANVVNYLWPVFVIIFSIPILKEKFNYKTILAALISFTGALIVFTGGRITDFSGEFTVGYLLAAAAAVCYGLFSVLGKRLHYEKYTSMLFYYIFATLLIIPATLLFSDLKVPHSPVTIISVLLLGGVITSISFVFWFKALESGHTHKTANAIYAVPFLALVWTYFLNSEPIRIYSVVGLMMIILGIIMQMKNKA